MRIFSVFVTLGVAWTMIFPQHVLANQKENANNIKIEFKIDDSIAGKFQSPYIFEGYVPISKNKEGTKFLANISAYTAATDECGKSDGITASGKIVEEYHTIACPPQFKFGTKIKIKGYGTFVCEDRGGAIKSNKLDIYMKTKQQAFRFGRRNLIVEVIKN